MRQLYKVCCCTLLVVIMFVDAHFRPALISQLDKLEGGNVSHSGHEIDKGSNRYLLENTDDDRHENGPNEGDVTNSPTIFGHTRSPSMPPTLTPTSPPSSRPSSLPSTYSSSIPTVSPSIQPSMNPTSLPSLDPCKGYDGDFGDTSGDLSINIFFNYGVETDKFVEKDMKATLSDQIEAIEKFLLDILISRIFSECSNNTRRKLRSHNIFLGKEIDDFHDLEVVPSPVRQKYLNNSQAHYSTSINKSSTGEIVGISSSPVDLANGKKCLGDYNTNTQFNAQCNVIEGRLTVYLSEIAFSNTSEKYLLQEIASIMDDDLLDDCHPALLSVIFINTSKIIAKSPVDDDFLADERDVSSEPNSMWMFAVGGIVLAFSLASFTRYRYSSQTEDDDFGESFRDLSDNSADRILDVNPNAF